MLPNSTFKYINIHRNAEGDMSDRFFLKARSEASDQIGKTECDCSRYHNIEMRHRID